MKNRVELIEIPAADFDRTVKFYEAVFGIKLVVYDCDDTEKMAFFPASDSKPDIAISWTEGFRPSADGVHISLHVENIETTLTRIQVNGGKIIRPKTKIEVEGKGYFAQFADSEGNTLGLYATEED